MASFIAPIIGGLAGLFGGGNQQKTKTSGTIGNTQSGTFNQTGSTTGATQNVHNLSPLQQTLAQQFTSGAQKLAGSAADMTGYTSKGLEDINQGAQSNTNIINNMLASRGLSFSPAAATTQTQNLANTQNQNANFLQQIPLLQRQLQEQANTGLERAFSTLPVDTSQTTQGTTNQSGSTSQQGTQTQQGTNLVSGNPMGGLFSGLGAGLTNPIGNSSNLAEILARLFGGGSGHTDPNNPNNYGG
jgi:hypothetical protein